jgi:hypothetical protein
MHQLVRPTQPVDTLQEIPDGRAKPLRYDFCGCTHSSLHFTPQSGWGIYPK